MVLFGLKYGTSSYEENMGRETDGFHTLNFDGFHFRHSFLCQSFGFLFFPFSLLLWIVILEYFLFLQTAFFFSSSGSSFSSSRMSRLQESFFHFLSILISLGFRFLAQAKSLDTLDAIESHHDCWSDVLHCVSDTFACIERREGYLFESR